MCSLGFKVQNKVTSCSCSWRALAKLVSRDGNPKSYLSMRDSGEGTQSPGLRARRPGFQYLLGQSEWDFIIAGIQSPPR